MSGNPSPTLLAYPLFMVSPNPAKVVRVPYLDREVQGIYGLQYLGRNLVEA